MVGLGWLVNDVAVDDLAIKTPRLVSDMASASCRQRGRRCCRCCVVVEVVVDAA